MTHFRSVRQYQI